MSLACAWDRNTFSFDDEEDEVSSDVQSDDIRKKVMLDSGNSVDFTA